MLVPRYPNSIAAFRLHFLPRHGRASASIGTSGAAASGSSRSRVRWAVLDHHTRSLGANTARLAFAALRRRGAPPSSSQRIRSRCGIARAHCALVRLGEIGISRLRFIGSAVRAVQSCIHILSRGWRAVRCVSEHMPVAAHSVRLRLCDVEHNRANDPDMLSAQMSRSELPRICT